MKRKLLAFIMALLLSVSAFAEGTIYYPAPDIQENLPEERPLLSEDFYVHVNYDRLKTAEMKEGMPVRSAFTNVADEIFEEMIEILENESGEGPMSIVFDFYHKYVDIEARNKAGWSAVVPFVEKIMSAKTAKELLEASCSSPVLAYLTFPIAFGVEADGKDSRRQVAYLGSPNLDLLDSAEYKQMTDFGKLYKDADDIYFTKLLTSYGFDAAEAAQIVANQFAFETKMAEYTWPTEMEYRADWRQMNYNPYTEEELLELAGDFPLAMGLEAFNLAHKEKYIINQPEFFAGMQNLFTDENLEEARAWMLLILLRDAAGFVDMETLIAKNDWINMTDGSSGMSPIEVMAYGVLCKHFPELMGQLYAERFFSAEEKEDVTGIVYDLIAVYRNRLENIDWLSDETRDIAIEKLDAMGVYVGYPEEFKFDYSGIELSEDASLYELELAYDAKRMEVEASLADTDVNRAAWGWLMPVTDVNACYYPSTNSIYFSAAILNAPFYSKEQSVSAKMGAIGTVIGHEITHAFDTAGSQFDKYGNMENWWTEEDREAFDARTNAVADRYSAYVLVDGVPTNGGLVIGETVADLGGASAALQVLENLKNEGEEINYAEFFEANAEVWCQIIAKPTLIYLLKNDPHAPTSLRVNVNLPQFDEFYETYDIKPGDKMYTAPEDRLKVW